MVKLNLGCGGQISSDKDPDWIDIDLYTGLDNPHVKKADMKKLDFIGDNTVELIYMVHSVEHIGKNERSDAFKEWYRVLKPRGILHMICPDLMWVARKLIENGGDLDANFGATLRDCIYGGQSGQGDIHYTGFTKTSIIKDLKIAGFQEDKINVQEGFWHDEQLGLNVRATK